MSNTRIEHIRIACEELLAGGRDITFAAVAQASGISRASCYRDRELRTIIDTYRARHGDMLTLTGLADQVDNLTQTLEALAERVRRQEEEIRTLKRAPTTTRASKKKLD
ncbi:MAG: DUF6262 family protein [Marmoricola sp.]